MKVELIPVIEIFNSNENIKLPDLGPSWKYKDEWETYHYLCNKADGFSEKLKSYTKGSWLYKVDEISDEDLLLLIYKEIETQQTEENNGIEDLACSFSGGYVLRLDDVDVYFPQCCGCLADIKEWEGLISGKTKSFYPGHPFPRVTENENKIRFDFIDIEIRESFAPPVPVNIVEIEKIDLKLAIAEANKILQIFADQLIKINEKENLSISNIDRRLIWADEEFD